MMMTGDKKKKIAQKTDKPGPVEERLVPGEKIVKTGKIHTLGIYWKSVAVLLLSVILANYVFELGAVLAGAGVLMFIHATILHKILLVVLTNKRVLVRYGIVQVDVVDVHFDKIESMELERMLPGYIMGYANIVIMGTGNRYIIIPYIANGVEIRRAYNEMVFEKDESQD